MVSFLLFQPFVGGQATRFIVDSLCSFRFDSSDTKMKHNGTISKFTKKILRMYTSSDY
jgi:hypothetical protein